MYIKQHPVNLNSVSTATVLAAHDKELTDNYAEHEAIVEQLREAVTAPKLATDAVTADNILADAVTTVKILNGAITTAKFAVDAKCPLAGTADLATNATNATTAAKVANALTINGTPYDGSSAKSLTTTAVSITAGTIADGGTIPLPSGYTRAQCKYAVWPHRSNTTNTKDTYFTWIDCQVDQGTGLVYCSTHYKNTDGEALAMIGTAGYLCIGVK